MLNVIVIYHHICGYVLILNILHYLVVILLSYMANTYVHMFYHKCERLSPQNIYYVKRGVAVNDLWKIIVLVVKQMLHIRKPLFDEPKNISITVADDVRICTFRWSFKDGDVS